jgi:hypothetical protein
MTFSISYQTPEGKTITTGSYHTKRQAENAAVRQANNSATPWLRSQRHSIEVLKNGQFICFGH